VKLEALLMCLQNMPPDIFLKNMTKTHCHILFLEKSGRIKFFPANLSTEMKFSSSYLTKIVCAL